MTEQHSITPPPELVKQWANESPTLCSAESWAYELFIAHYAARWGADQELEACCEWLDFYAAASEARDLRVARRPKPPSLKEEALHQLEAAERLYPADWSTIRKALEQLDG
jgi:hypothetical protein